MLKLRAASIKDLSIVKYWDTQQHVIDCDPDDDWNWEVELKRKPEWREQLVAELNGKPIGFVQIIDPHLEETHYWGDVKPNKRAIDIWIGEEHNLNKGYGTTIMAMAIKRCFSTPTLTSILIDPLKTNTKAHRFYERLGFEFVEERDFGESTCLVYELTRKRHQYHKLITEISNKLGLIYTTAKIPSTPSSGGVSAGRGGLHHTKPKTTSTTNPKRNTKNYMRIPYNAALKPRAKALRKAGNLSEILFWNRVKQKQFKGFDFDRQKIIGNYIVDFYCANCNVVIEIDGSSHIGKEDYDAKRDAYLESLGLTVIHIQVKDVLKGLDKTMGMLYEHKAFSLEGGRRSGLGSEGEETTPALSHPFKGGITTPSFLSPPKEGIRRCLVWLRLRRMFVVIILVWTRKVSAVS